ncbi:hypothetical protein AKJ09_08160 [Labilithrix luteola]|uniref:Uncharacterized protein n=1 Tax=Labilithrix luteola TaxID=1391654 RepID=A0A0K1Q760_9BACT|nr:hypothetical protein AKJ09_08160 [Labilithrix luteola]
MQPVAQLVSANAVATHDHRRWGTIPKAGVRGRIDRARG